MAMSREAGQGRGASSRGRQRSPEELAAVLARLADQAGDPKPRERSGSGRRRSGSPLRPPIVEPPTQRFPDAPARVAERPAPRRAKPPEARVAEPPPVVPKPAPAVDEPAPVVEPPPARVAESRRRSSTAACARHQARVRHPETATPQARVAATARAAPTDRAGRRVAARSRHGQRPDRRHPDQPRRRAWGSVGFRAAAAGDQQQRHRRRPRHPEAPAAEHSQGAPRGPTRARTQDTRRGTSAAQPCVGPDRRPAALRPPAADADPSRWAHVAARPRRAGRARDLARGDHQRRLRQARRRNDADKAGCGARGDHAGHAGIERPDGDAGHDAADDRADGRPLSPRAHKAAAANKTHHGAAKHTAPSKPASTTGGAASTAASGNTTAATSPARSAPAPYYRPAPPQPQPSSGSAGSSLGAAALLGHRHSHHKK